MAVTTKKQFPNAVGQNGQSATVFTPVGIQLNNQDDLDVYVTLSGGTRVLQLRQATGSTAQSTHPQVNNTDGLYFPAVSAGTTLYNYQLSSDNNTITFSTALPTNATVFVERRTRDADSSYTTFASGSTIRATDLNNSSTESNFTAQDARNKAFDLEGKLFDGPADNTIKTKLDGIEANATQDQTASEIRALVESASDSNVFTDADHSKLDGIEAGATADQTNADIRAAVEAATDSNVFTDADHTKLNSVETGATADQTNAEIRAAVEAATDSNVFTDADHTKLNGIEAGATADQTNAEIRAAVEAATDSNVFTDADHSKLNAIEAGATADQSDAEIKTAYENNSDTNAFTDAEKTKLGNLGSLNALSDVNTSGVSDGKILKYDASASEFIIADDGGAGGGGSSTFTGLSDTPANFGSAAGKVLKVNSGETALEFSDADVVADTSPQLGGNLDVQTNEITTSTTNGNVKVTPNGTGVVEIKGAGGADGTLQLNCSQNSHGVKIKSPAHSNSASYALTLPTGITANQPLVTDSNGALSWSNGFASLSGASFTGNIGAFGGITLGNADTIKFDSDDSDTNHISFRGPNALSSTVTYTLPEDGSAGQFLKTDGSGVLSFGTVTTDLVGDTTPQLGGNLDLNGNDISGTGNFSINGSVSGNSLTTNAGNIIINSTAPTVSFVDSDANPDYQIKVNGGEFDIRDSTNSASRLKIGTTGEVTSQGKLNCQAGLDTDGDVVFNSDTTNVGVTFDASTSTLNMSDSQALSFGDHSTTGDYNLSYVNGSDFNIVGQSGGSGDLVLGTYGSGSVTKTLVSKRSNQALELYFANSKKLETVTGGVTVTGTCTATAFAGDGSALTGISTTATVAGGAIYENSQTISSTHTIPVGSNGMSAGPVTINDGISLTISNGSTYTIV